QTHTHTHTHTHTLSESPRPSTHTHTHIHTHTHTHTHTLTHPHTHTHTHTRRHTQLHKAAENPSSATTWVRAEQLILVSCSFLRPFLAGLIRIYELHKNSPPETFKTQPDFPFCFPAFIKHWLILAQIL